MTTPQQQIRVSSLAAKKRAGEKIAVLTCYDASLARVLEQAGVEVLLVGDSLGMVLQGRETTLPVRLEDMIYHSSCVARGRRVSLLVTDLPFMSYATVPQALDSAARLMQEGGAQMVKLEGAGRQLEVVRRLTEQGIPVCGHLGLLPQSVHRIGGYRVQGRDPHGAETILRDAFAMQEAGAAMLVLECVPSGLAAEISASVEIPVIGIGAGPGCDGQVLVLHDMLGISPDRPPRFSHNFLAGHESIPEAVLAYVEAVKNESFPAPEHCFD